MPSASCRGFLVCQGAFTSWVACSCIPSQCSLHYASHAILFSDAKHVWLAGHAPRGGALCCGNCWKLGRPGEGPIREALLFRACQHCNCGLHPVSWTQQHYLYIFGALHQHPTDKHPTDRHPTGPIIYRGHALRQCILPNLRRQELCLS